MNQEALFQQEKQRLRERLERVREECEALQREVGIDLGEALAKVQHGLDNLSRERVTIAILGAVKDGKSSLVGILSGQPDIAVAAQPATQEVRIYESADLLWVDTPGLYSQDTAHDERTRRYLSEAHVVLFLTDAVNPIKESHQALVRWLFQDLRKGDAVLVVLNKMDQVADLEDEHDFNDHAQRKIAQMRQTLAAMLGSDPEVPVLAIAGNPYGRGVAHWLGQPEQYGRLSRLPALEAALRERLRGARQQLFVSAEMSTLRDAIQRAIQPLREARLDSEPALRVLTGQAREAAMEVERLQQRLISTHASIRSEVVERRRGLLLDLDHCTDMAQLASFLQREVGAEGHILATSLELIVTRHAQALRAEATQVVTDLGEALDSQQGLLESLAELAQQPFVRSVLSALQAAPLRKVADSVISVRNLLGLPLRFGPWGAMKLAKGVKMIPWLGPLMEGGQVLAEWLTEQRLGKAVPQIKESLEQAFAQFLEGCSLESYQQQCFPSLPELREIAEALQKQANECTKRQQVLLAAELRLERLAPIA